MASIINGGTIRYKIETTLDKSGINKIESELAKLQTVISSKSSGKGIGSDIKKQLSEASVAAKELETTLAAATNPKTGTVNMQRFNQMLKINGSSLNQLGSKMSAMGPQGAAAFAKINSQLKATNTTVKKTTNYLTEMANTFVKSSMYSIAYSAFNKITGEISHAVNFVEQLDGSLNRIRIITGDSADKMEQFAQSANKAAKELAQSTKAYSDAALIFYEQGLSDKEVEARTNVTMKVANVTGQSTDEVSEELTAVWNGFKVDSADAEKVIDQLAAVAANSASNLEELSTAMSKVASSANTMGVSSEQLTAQIATIEEATRQAPESIGTALKTIYARIGDLKADGTDEFGVSLGEVSGQMKKMGIEVLDENNQMKDMGSIIEEVSAKWQGWSKEQKEAAAIAMAGKRQYNNLFALFENWDRYSENLDVATNSLGTLQTQQETYLDSIGAKQQQFKASMETIYGDVISDDFLKGFYDTAKDLAGIFEKILTPFDGVGKSLQSWTMILLGIGNILSQKIGKSLSNQILFGSQNVSLGKQQLQLKREESEAEEKRKKAVEETNKIYEKIHKNAENARNQGKEPSAAGAQGKSAAYSAESELNAVKQTVALRERLLNIQSAMTEEEVETANATINKVQQKTALINSNSLELKGLQERVQGNEELKGIIDGMVKSQREGKQITEDQVKKAQELAEEYKKAQDIINKKGFNSNGKRISPGTINKNTDILQQKGLLTKKQAEEIKNTEDATEKWNLYTKALKSAGQAGKGEQDAIELIIEKLQEMGINIKDVGGELDTLRKKMEFEEKTQKFQQGVTGLTTAMTSIPMAISSISGSFEALGDDSLSTGEKMQQMLMGLGMGVPMLIRGLKGAKEAMQLFRLENLRSIAAMKLGKTASEAGAIGFREMGLAAWESLGPYVAVALAIGAVVGAIYLLVKAYNADQEAAEEAAETQKAVKENYDKIKESYESLKQSLADYNDQKKALDEMTKGTDEWREAVMKNNDAVLELMNNYKELGEYVQDDNGVLSISEEGQQKILEEQRQKVEEAKISTSIATINANEKAQKSHKTNLQRDLAGITVASDPNMTGYQYGATQTQHLNQDNIDTLVEAFNKGELNFNSEESLKEDLKALGINENYAATLEDNSQALKDLAEEVRQNNIVNKQLEESVGQSFLKEKLGETKYEAMDEGKAKVEAEIIGKALSDRTNEIYKETYEDAFGNKDDDTIQEEYAKLINASQTRNLDDDEGEYFINGEWQKISDSVARMALAQKDAEKEMEQKIGKLNAAISKLETASTYLNMGDKNALSNFISNGTLSGASSIQGLKDKVGFKEENGYDFSTYLMNSQSQDEVLDALGLTEEDVIEMGYADGRAFMEALSKAAESYEKEDERIENSIIEPIKEAYNSLNPDQFTQEVRSDLSKVLSGIFRDGGNDAVDAFTGSLSGLSKENQAEFIKFIKENGINDIDALKQKYRELGGEIDDVDFKNFLTATEDATKHANDFKKSLDELSKSYESAMKILKDKKAGDFFTEEEYKSIIAANSELSKYFVKTLDGYALVGKSITELEKDINGSVENTVSNYAKIKEAQDRLKWGENYKYKGTEVSGTQSVINLLQGKTREGDALPGPGKDATDTEKDAYYQKRAGYIADVLNEDGDMYKLLKERYGKSVVDGMVEGLRNVQNEDQFNQQVEDIGAKVSEAYNGNYTTQDAIKEQILANGSGNTGNLLKIGLESGQAIEGDDDIEKVNNMEDAQKALGEQLSAQASKYPELTEEVNAYTKAVDEHGAASNEAKQALANLTSELDKSKWRKFSEDIVDSVQKLNDAKGQTQDYYEAMDKIVEMFKSDLGIEVDRKFVEENKKLINDYIDGVDGAAERLKALSSSKAINLNDLVVREGKDPITELTDSAGEKYASLYAYLKANPLEIDANGKANLQPLIQSLWSAGATAEQIGQLLASIGNTEITINGTSIDLTNADSMQDFVAALGNGENIATMSASGSFPAGVSPNMTSKKKDSGSGSKATHEKLDLESPNLDPFRDLTKQMEKLQKIEEKLADSQNKAFGQDAINNVNKLNKNLKAQIELNKKLVKTGIQEIANKRYDMKKLYGFKFNKDGTIKDGNATINKLYEEYSKDFNKYNNMSTAEQQSKEGKTLKKKVDKEKTRMKDGKTVMGEYDDLMEKVRGYIEEEIAKQQEIWSNNLSALEQATEDHKSQREWQRSFIDYKKDTFRGDDYDKISKANLKTAKTYQEDIKSNNKEILELNKALEDIQKKGHSKKYGTDVTAIRTRLKELSEDNMEKMQTLRQLYEENVNLMIQNNHDYIESLEKVGKQLDNIKTKMQAYADIAKLIYGDKNFKVQQQYLDGMFEADKQNYSVLKETIQGYKDQRKSLRDIYKGMKDSDVYNGKTKDAIKQEIDDLTTKIDDGQATLAQKATSLVQDALDIYHNSVNSIFQEFESDIAGNFGWDGLSQVQKRLDDYSKKYVNNNSRLYQTNKLIYDIDKAALDVANQSAAAQRKIADFRKQSLDYLQKQDKLSQYDLDREQARFNLLLKEIALQEAQENKSQLKLRRDAQGNYSYVYGSDQENIAKAEQERAEANRKVQELDEKQVEETTNRMLEIYKKYAEEAKDIMNSTDSDEVKSQKLNALKEIFYKDIEGEADSVEEAMNNLRESSLSTYNEIYGTSFASYSEMTDKERDVYDDYLFGIDGVVPLSTQTKKLLNKDTDAIKDMWDKKVMPTWNAASKTYQTDLKDIDALTGGVISNTINGDGEENPGLVGLQESIKATTGKVADYKKEWENTTSALTSTNTQLSTLINTINGDDFKTTIKLTSQWADRTKDLEKASKNARDYLEKISTMKFDKFIENLGKAVSKVTTMSASAKDTWNSYKDYTVDNSGDSSENNGNDNNNDNDNGGGIKKQPNGIVEKGDSLSLNSQSKTNSLTMYNSLNSNKAKGEAIKKADITGKLKVINNKGSFNKNSSFSMMGNMVQLQFTQRVLDEKMSSTAHIPIYKNTKRQLWIPESILKNNLIGYDTGGYTGDWHSKEGKMAMLHEKEIVLNKQDTENMLKAVELVRQLDLEMSTSILDISKISNILNSEISSFIDNLSKTISASSKSPQTSPEIQQKVDIQATFTDATTGKEIEAALRGLVNKASQEAWSKNF